MKIRRLVECVMNVSEGQDHSKLKEIANRIREVPEVFLLDYSADTVHNRTVFTFVGNPIAICRAAFTATEEAIKLIDLRFHNGVHPRIGAVDVIPFVPLIGVTMEECTEIAHRLGKQIALQLDVPVYFYGKAATDLRRRNLLEIRREGFEKLRELIQSDPEKKPDFGLNRLHATAGAVSVGARPPLIAYNIYLDTADISVARMVASVVRESGGGLKGVQALGFFIDYKGLAQVSMNVSNYQKTSLKTVYDRVRCKALEFNTDVHSAEIVGLVPQIALTCASPQVLGMETFCVSKILEKRVQEVLGVTFGKAWLT